MNLTNVEISRFFSHLSVMLGAGMPIVSSLEALSRDPAPAPSAFARHLLEQVSSGCQLSVALGSWPQALSPLIIGTTRMAEDSGTLSQSFQSIADELERQVASRNRLVSSLTYPLVLFLVSGSMLAFLIQYMLPRFLPFLIDGKVEIPALTKGLLWLSSSMAPQVFCFGLLLLATLLRTPTQRSKALNFLAGLVMNSPLGKLIVLKSYGDVCLQISMLLERGILLEPALTSVITTSWPLPVSDSLRSVREAIRQGESISVAFQELYCPPKILPIFLRTGEEVGEMALFFERLGQLLEEDYLRKLESFFQVLEPVIMLVMGVLVGAVVLACFLPIYAMATQSF